jgi:hypothetical protein
MKENSETSSSSEEIGDGGASEINESSKAGDACTTADGRSGYLIATGITGELSCKPDGES